MESAIGIAVDLGFDAVGRMAFHVFISRFIFSDNQ